MCANGLKDLRHQYSVVIIEQRQSLAAEIPQSDRKPMIKSHGISVAFVGDVISENSAIFWKRLVLLYLMLQTFFFNENCIPTSMRPMHHLLTDHLDLRAWIFGDELLSLCE